MKASLHPGDVTIIFSTNGRMPLKTNSVFNILCFGSSKRKRKEIEDHYRRRRGYDVQRTRSHTSQGLAISVWLGCETREPT
jgi:hypothetical protein